MLQDIQNVTDAINHVLEYWYFYLIGIIVAIILIKMFIKFVLDALIKLIIEIVKLPINLIIRYPILLLFLSAGAIVWVILS